MLFVLQLEDGTQRRQVPLADATAARLEQALLAIGDEARVAALVAALVGDPALAIWAFLSAKRQGGVDLQTATDAAGWLGDCLAAKLAAGAIAPDEGSLARVPSGEDKAIATMHARVVSAACTGQASDDATTDAADSTAYWSAITAAGDRLVATWPVEAHAERRLLPTFPTTLLPAQPRPHDEVQPTGDELVDWFLAVEAGIERRLPALLAKLCHCERVLDDFDRRLEQEKLDAVKELAYGASHEINNPLANIAARAQTLARDEADPERRRKLTAIHRQAMRAHEMIADLMLFARPPQLQLAPCDLASLAGEVVAELADLAGQRQTQLSLDVRDATAVEADRTQLGAALAAVVTNAIEAVGTGGHVEVAVREASVDGERCAELMVRDDGPGISDEVREHIFDPFFSGREAGRGLGFGLSKCWRIVTDHGGRVVIHNAPHGGCELTMSLPTTRQPVVVTHNG